MFYGTVQTHEAWLLNESQRSKVQAVETRSLRRSQALQGETAQEMKMRWKKFGYAVYVGIYRSKTINCLSDMPWKREFIKILKEENF